MIGTVEDRKFWRVPRSGFTWTPDDDPDFPGGVLSRTPGPLLALLRMWLMSLDEAQVLRCVAGCATLASIGALPRGMAVTDEDREVFLPCISTDATAMECRLGAGWYLDIGNGEKPGSAWRLPVKVEGLEVRPVKLAHRRAVGVIDGVKVSGSATVVEGIGPWRPTVARTVHPAVRPYPLRFVVEPELWEPK